VILLAKNAQEQVTQNRKKCDEIMRAVGVIEGVIKQHERELSIDDEQYLSVMQEIYETMNEVASFIDSHTKGNHFTRLMKGREYEVTFNRIMNRLDECLDLLQTALEHRTENLVREYGEIRRNQSEQEKDDLLASESTETPPAVLQQRLCFFRDRIASLRAELQSSEEPPTTLVDELMNIQREMVDTQKEFVSQKERHEKREAIRMERAAKDCPPEIDVLVWKDLPDDIKDEIKQTNARKAAAEEEKAAAYERRNGVNWTQRPQHGQPSRDGTAYNQHLRSAYGSSYEQLASAPPPPRPPRYDYAYTPVIYPSYHYPRYYF